jgi:peptidoglycan hydrolase-like protein with peptidoglycan-binding domain
VPRIATTTLGWATLTLAIALACFWAGRATFSPPAPPTADMAQPTYTVVEESIGRQIPVPVQASWPQHDIAVNSAEGVITSTNVAPGQVLHSGDTLITVNLRPVVALEGAIPVFRDLQSGTAGDDVRQLQAFLNRRGARLAADGRFESATARAVRSWQKDLGIEQTGVVGSGDIVFVPHLPARVTLAEGVTVGTRIAPGQSLLRSLQDTPTFTVTLSSDQAGAIPANGAVIIHSSDGDWESLVTKSESHADGKLLLTLDGPNGEPPCGNQCSNVPIVAEDALYDGAVIVAPPVTGPAVPAAALQTRADGTAFVVTEDGTETQVEVLGDGSGRAVVSGIDVGDSIRLFGASDQNPSS